MYEYYHHRKFIKEIEHQTEYFTARLDAIRDECNSCDKELMYLIGYIDGQLGESCNPHMTNKQFKERISIIIEAYESLRRDATKEAAKDANDIIDRLEKGLL
jgi:hypothetical protein